MHSFRASTRHGRTYTIEADCFRTEGSYLLFERDAAAADHPVLLLSLCDVTRVEERDYGDSSGWTEVGIAAGRGPGT